MRRLTWTARRLWLAVLVGVGGGWVVFIGLGAVHPTLAPWMGWTAFLAVPVFITVAFDLPRPRLAAVIPGVGAGAIAFAALLVYFAIYPGD